MGDMTGAGSEGGAFRPGPGGYPPPLGELSERHCKYSAGLLDLLAAQLKRHRSGNGASDYFITLDEPLLHC